MKMGVPDGVRDHDILPDPDIRPGSHARVDSGSVDGDAGEVAPESRSRDATPPSALSGTGVQSDGTTIRIEVRVCLGTDGRLWSSHQPATIADEVLQLEWSGGGHRHVAHALLTEAVRRESFVCLLVALTRDRDLVQKYVRADESGKQKMISDLSDAVQESLQTSSKTMIIPSVQEALGIILSQSSVET